MKNISPALLALALASFGIGTTEFVIMGLLPEIAVDLSVSIPRAGMLVTGYALGVAIGAPIMAIATARLPRRTALITLMGIFIAGNFLCAIAPNYGFLMTARVVTALCHGAFFGIGAAYAAGLVAENRRASAIALMFTGLTLANVLGVPFGTAFGQVAGWQAPFWAICALGVITFAALIAVLPKTREEQKTDIAAEIRALGNSRIWLSLALTVLFAAAMFTTFTYIAPILKDITKISDHGVSITLLLIGAGLTAGNIIGGRLADWRLLTALAGIFAVTAVMNGIFGLAAGHAPAALAVLFLWGVVTFAAVPGLQINVVRFARAAPGLVSTLNIGAFNVGNALGAAAGGLVISSGPGLAAVPFAAAGFPLLALLLTAGLARAGDGAARTAAAGA